MMALSMSEKKRIHRSEFLRMVLGIVLLAVVVGAGYFAYQAIQPSRTAPVSITWLGHSSFLVRHGDKIIYLDPYAGEYVDKADLILVTHSHPDHYNTTKIDRIRKDGTIVIAPADVASKIGGPVKTLGPGERASFGDITVGAVEAYNYKRFRSPGNPYHPKGFGVGYLLKLGDKTIYHAGDTDFIPEMGDLKNIYLALLPTGGTFTMDNPEAVEAALAIKPRFVIPMHSREADTVEFKKGVESRSTEIKVILLKPSEELRLE